MVAREDGERSKGIRSLCFPGKEESGTKKLILKKKMRSGKVKEQFIWLYDFRNLFCQRESVFG